MVYVAVLFTIIPFRSILLMVYPEVSKETNPEDFYSNQRFGFLNDYDWLNPVTSKQAKVDFYQDL